MLPTRRVPLWSGILTLKYHIGEPESCFLPTKFWTPEESDDIRQAIHNKGFAWVIQHGSLIDRIAYEPVRSEEGLRRTLLQLPSKKDRNLELWHESDDHLNVSVEGELAFVQWTKGAYGDGAPYMTTWTKKKASDYVEFLVGDTPTPIESGRCVPIETMVRVVLHYYNHRELLRERGLTWKAV